jgi:cell wall-associated NlpC family hydrolase
MLPGDFAVVATGGIMGRIIRLVTRSKVNHAMILVHDGQVIEAAPSGATVSPLSNYAGMTLTWSALDLTLTQRAAIVTAARTHIGAPYSWVDDACIGLAAIFDWHVPAWVRRRLASPDHLMCSQLVDTCYLEAEIHLFADGRMPGDVTPGDLACLIAGEPVPTHW